MAALMVMADPEAVNGFGGEETNRRSAALGKRLDRLENVGAGARRALAAVLPGLLEA